MRVFLVLLLFIPHFLFSQNVGIGTSTPDANALLDVESSSRGILIPRLSTSERNSISAPITKGLLIFNATEDQFEFWNGSVWVSILDYNTKVFESSGTLIKQANGFNQDFLVGRSSLPSNGELIADNMLLFSKSKGAFRVGNPDNTADWSPDSIGNYSIGLGENVKAKGIGSISMGTESRAYMDYSVAIGAQARALGGLSMAMGFGSIATGSGTTSVGENAIAEGSSSSAFGTSSYSKGLFSTALGYGSISNGDYSIALGSAYTNGEYAVAAGSGASANGFGSAAFGVATRAESFGETALGLWNTTYTPNNGVGWSPQDRLLVVGNGSSSSNPSDALLIQKNGNAFFPSGDLLVGRNASPTNGELLSENLLMFSKSNGAFRVGSPDNTADWSPDSIGNYSIGFGQNVKAKGLGSISMGTESRAYTEYSVAIGAQARALGGLSMALGFGSVATGSGTTSVGENAVAEGSSSSAFGTSSYSKGLFSTALGYGSISNGDYSIALGSAYTDGDYAVAGGSGASANGFGSTAFGVATRAESFGETALGLWNTTYTPNNGIGWSPDDRLFVIGNGTSSSNPSDAMIILKNGKTTINEDLTINSANEDTDFELLNSNITDGRVLTRQFSTNDIFVGDIDNNGADLVLRAAGANRVVIGSTGNVAINNGDFYSLNSLNDLGQSARRWNTAWLVNGVNNTSDLRLKKNIKNLPYGIEDLMKLRPVSYEWKENDDGVKIGLIAQELEAVIPEVVYVPEDPSDFMSVNYTELIPVLIKTIQDQQEIIQNQSADIKELKQLNSKNDTLFDEIIKRLEALEAMN